MTSFSLDPTLWGPIGQVWRWVMADREIQNLHTKKKTNKQKKQNKKDKKKKKQPLDKTQSSKFCLLGVKRTPFQNLKKKRKWFLIIVAL